jgi:hypothetical protein
MKKTINRVRREPTSAAKNSQAPKRLGKSPRLHTRQASQSDEADPVTLSLQYPDGREFARVDLPAAIYARIETSCRERGQSVGQFIEQAVAAKIGASAGAGVAGKGSAR